MACASKSPLDTSPSDSVPSPTPRKRGRPSKNPPPAGQDSGVISHTGVIGDPSADATAESEHLLNVNISNLGSDGKAQQKSGRGAKLSNSRGPAVQRTNVTAKKRSPPGNAQNSQRDGSTWKAASNKRSGPPADPSARDNRKARTKRLNSKAHTNISDEHVGGSPVMRLTSRIVLELQKRGLASLLDLSQALGGEISQIEAVLDVLYHLKVVEMLQSTADPTDILYAYGQSGLPNSNPASISNLSDSLEMEQKEIALASERIGRLKVETEKLPTAMDLPSLITELLSKNASLQREALWKSFANAVGSPANSLHHQSGW